MPRSPRVTCEECGDEVFQDDAVSSSGYLYCQNCYDNMEGNYDDDL
jgi:formylmethanofuran dehydrogenase subunit E